MKNISVLEKSLPTKGQEEWIYEVRVGEEPNFTVHNVEVSKEYWKELTGGQVAAKELVRKSFEFLLARESKESILREFKLPLIQKYFPEYEEYIKSLLIK